MKFSKIALAACASAVVLAGCGSKAKTELIMITEATFPPYEFLRGTEIVGIDVAIGQEIAKEMGLTLKVEDAKFDACIPSVISGKADLSLAGITITEDRKQSVDFTVPYVTSGIVILSKKDNLFKDADSVKGKKVGVQSGTTSDTFCVEDLKQEPERFDSPAAAVAALKAGKVDLVIADIDPAKNLEKSDADICISSDFLTKEEFAGAIAKGNAELLAAANRAIENLKASGKLAEIIAQYTAEADALVAAEEAAAPAEEAKAEEAVEAVEAKVADVAAAVEAKVEAVAEAVEAKVEEAKPVVEEVKAAVEEKVEEVKAAVEEAKPAVEAKVEEVKAEAAEVVEAAEAKVAEVVEAVEAKVEEAKPAVEAKAEAVEAKVEAVAEAVEAKAAAVVEALAPAAE